MTQGRVLVASLLFAACSWAQTKVPQKAETHGPVLPPATAASTTEPWEYSLTVDGYIISGQDGYAQPTFTADHKWLHLEARYNYEDFRTASLWAGYNFSWGKTWQFAVTPMIGGIFGRTNGIAPGCEASVSWKVFELALDNEYVFDTTSKSGNFYYAWPQLTITPVGWFKFGGMAQHTKTFATNVDVQRGFFVGFMHKRLEFTTYVFDPGSNSSTVILEVGASF